MRLQLHLSPNTEPVPFNHLHQLTGALHKWLGPNNIHDGMSLYSFGWLRGGEKMGRYLHFPNGSTWNVSFYESDQAWELAKGIINDDMLAFGMRVTKALEVDQPQFLKKHTFFLDGVALARQAREDGTREYLLWDNPITDKVLTSLLQKKLTKAGFKSQHLDVSIAFDRSYVKPKTKLVEIKGTKHKGSACPIIIEGTPEVLDFAWKVGVGELTGSGFGALV